MKKKLKIPRFKNERDESRFWQKINLADYFEADDFTSVSFPNLKPTSRSISLRLPEYLLSRLKQEAHQLNIPYQTLVKQYIARGVLNAGY